ncbi:MAG: hypothetical protein IJ814_08390 [Paludibacteraceae bacterium]|nr:hypothetical protein [Paludibacteraceae bacterium]
MNYLPLDGKPDSLKRYTQICNDCCDQAEKILHEMDDPSPIADLVREVMYYARYMGQFEHTLPQAYTAAKRIAECLFEHPRLMLELKLLQLELVHYAEAIEGHEFDITEDLRAEINTLRYNIQMADEDHLEAIRDGRMLKSDPIEWTKAYEEAIDDADKEAYANLTDAPRGMGFCFGYWAEKRKALAKRGIEWRSPGEMNPRVMFD